MSFLCKWDTTSLGTILRVSGGPKINKYHQINHVSGHIFIDWAQFEEFWIELTLSSIFLKMVTSFLCKWDTTSLGTRWTKNDLTWPKINKCRQMNHVSGHIFADWAQLERILNLINFVINFLKMVTSFLCKWDTTSLGTIVRVSGGPKIYKYRKINHILNPVTSTNNILICQTCLIFILIKNHVIRWRYVLDMRL